MAHGVVAVTHADKLRWVGDQLDADASNKGIGQGSEGARYCWAVATEIERIEAELEHTKEDYLNACATIANMHCAAVGEVTGPKRGVVEDIEDLRLERDAPLASKQMDFAQLVAQEDEIKLLEAEIANLQKAITEYIERIELSADRVEQLEAENKQLQEALEARRDWFI